MYPVQINSDSNWGTWGEKDDAHAATQYAFMLFSFTVICCWSPEEIGSSDWTRGLRVYVTARTMNTAVLLTDHARGD